MSASALQTAIRSAAQQQADAASFDLARKIPNMRCRGFRIETSYGEIDIDAADGQQITDLVQRILHKRLTQAGGAA